MATKALAKAVAAGTVPCAICRKEHDPSAGTLLKGRCVNRQKCLKQAATGWGKLPKFMTFPQNPPTYRRGRFVRPTLTDKQDAAYYAVLAEEREARRIDLAVV